MSWIDVDKVEALAEKGYIDKEIADKLGYRLASITACRMNNGIEAGSKQAADRWKSEIAKLMASGYRLKEIVDMIGLPRSTVQRYAAGMAQGDTGAARYKDKGRRYDA